MTGKGRNKTNQRIREKVDIFVRGCRPGTKIDANDLRRRFSNRIYYLSPHRMARFFMEREDVHRKRLNVWVVIG